MAPRKSYPAAFKAKVVLAALREDKPLAQVAAEQGVHPHQLRRWKQTALDDLPRLFAGDSPQERHKQVERERLLELLYAEIGRLTTQLAWLKKKLVTTVGPAERRRMIEPAQPALPWTVQCELLGVSRG